MDTYPATRPAGVEGRSAIELCAEWLTYLGEDKVMISPPGSPFDLSSVGCIAWVTSKYGDVEPEYVVSAIASAETDSRLPVVFFQGGFDPDAQDLASDAGFALLQYDAGSALLSGLNERGRALRRL